MNRSIGDARGLLERLAKKLRAKAKKVRGKLRANLLALAEVYEKEAKS